MAACFDSWSNSDSSRRGRSEKTQQNTAQLIAETRIFLWQLLTFFSSLLFDSSSSGWSETGDRYLLSLFRDLVFHSLHSGDTPNVDWGHVVHQLNALDAGSAEKLLLSSRTGDAMLLVRYSDLRRAMEESYTDLLRRQHEGLGGGAIIAARQIMSQAARGVRSKPIMRTPNK